MLQASPDPLHTLLDIVTPLALAGVAVAGLMIRSKMAEAATKLIANRDAMKNQRVNNRRIPYGQAWRSGNYGGYGFRG